MNAPPYDRRAARMRPTVETLQRKADEVIVLATPADFEAVGKWYSEFPQVEDEEVLRLLQ